MKLTIGTRGSALALWQANHVADLLRAREPGLTVELTIIKTKGDKIQDVALAKVGGKGLFVKEIEDALLGREVDLAVHSMKDVPAELPAGLVIAATSLRADARDALCVRAGVAPSLAGLPEGAHVGTSSLRRLCQLRAARPDLRISPLRGNVDTRLRKLEEGSYDAIVLAAAGLDRLGLAGRIAVRLPHDVMLPAIAQGALGLETRADDAATIARIRAALHHDDTAAAVLAERTLLGRLDGGCQTPIAAHATVSAGQLALSALIGAPDGSAMVRGQGSGPASDAAAIGARVADELLARGGQKLLAAARAASLAGQAAGPAGPAGPT
ncbi:MAG: hydroxymethylbilane synthase [Deltaproteobacteria bacterium]|nr:hydroxymethylbilane synthase [Deltaproteobacteria bacterium]